MENILSRLEEAERLAKQGKVRDMETALILANCAAGKQNIDISDAVQKIEESGYRTGAAVQLFDAYKIANSDTPRLTQLEEHLGMARYCADQAKVDISDQVERIKGIVF